LVDRRGHTVIVNGLLNLDCVHDCHTELHPVFAIAIRDNPEEKISQNNPDTWTLFARNQGNEGSCAQDLHYLDRVEFIFYLPRPRANTQKDARVTANLGSTLGGVLNWSATADEGGVLLKLKLTDDKDNPEAIGVSGSVKIDWNGSGNGSGQAMQTVPGKFENNPSAFFKMIGNYIRPVVGPNLVRLWVPEARLWPIGFQGSPVSTALFSLHGEVQWALPKAAISTSGNQYTTHATLWLAGIDIGLGALRSFPNLMLELSGGKVNRSADAKNPGSPPLGHFQGKDSVFSYGFGYTFHPFKQSRFSVRTFIGDLYIPTSNDHVFRLTVSPQIRLRKAQ
jgi:hypothetical protein